MNRLIKWLGIGAGSVAGIAVLAFGVLYVVSEQRMDERVDVEPVALAIPDDSASIAHGRHLTRTIAKCQVCHGNSFEGNVFVEDPLLGRLSAPNITPAGVTAGYTDRDWIRAIRHGVRRDDRSVILMPSYEFADMSDDDLGAVVAYMKTLPPAAGAPPSTRLGPMIRMLIATDMFPILAAGVIDHASPRPPAPATAATPEYGRYLAAIGCMGCHGPTLQGGKPPATGPDITPAGRLAGWTEEDFRVVMRAGKRPDGTVVDLEMPWNVTAGMRDVELAAIWAYLNSVGGSSVAAGER